MPPLQPIEGVVKVVYNWLSPAGQHCANIFHVGYDTRTPIVPADFTAITTYMSAAGGSNFIPEYTKPIGNDYGLTSVHFTDLGAAHQQDETNPSVIGGYTTSSQAPSLSVVASWLANGVGWRGGRFRTYFPGLPVGTLSAPNNPEFTAAFRAYVLSAATGMITQVGAISATLPLKLGGVSYFTRPPAGGTSVPRPTPLWYPFQSVAVHGRVDSQRRRSGKESQFM